MAKTAMLHGALARLAGKAGELVAVASAYAAGWRPPVKWTHTVPEGGETSFPFSLDGTLYSHLRLVGPGGGIANGVNVELKADGAAGQCATWLAGGDSDVVEVQQSGAFIAQGITAGTHVVVELDWDGVVWFYTATAYKTGGSQRSWVNIGTLPPFSSTLTPVAGSANGLLAGGLWTLTGILR